MQGDPVKVRINPLLFLEPGPRYKYEFLFAPFYFIRKLSRLRLRMGLICLIPQRGTRAGNLKKRCKLSLDMRE